MESNALTIFFTLVNLLILAFTTYNQTRRNKTQMLLDGTQSIKNLQDTVESMQAQHEKDYATWEARLHKEQKENEYLRNELEQIKAMLKGAFLEFRVGMEIGQEPKILGYEWATKVEAPKK